MYIHSKVLQILSMSNRTVPVIDGIRESKKKAGGTPLPRSPIPAEGDWLSLAL